MGNAIQIRTAKILDAKRLLEIYAPYVINTAISFEYTTPSLHEFKKRIHTIQKKYPYIVAIQENKIIGYAYANVFKSRQAYSHCVETTIYVDQKFHKQGIGRILYIELEERLKAQGILNMNACIAYTELENEYLANGSEKFHEHMGFTLVGRFHKSGFKFNQWFDMIWMEKLIGEHK